MTEPLKCANCLAVGKDINAVTVIKGKAVCRTHVMVLHDGAGHVVGIEPDSMRRDES